MTGLGLRWCPNHPDTPLILVSGRTGTWWRCEHESGCAHTENAFSIRTGAHAVAINGKSVNRPSVSGRHHGTQGGSKVERDAIENLEES